MSDILVFYQITYSVYFISMSLTCVSYMYKNVRIRPCAVVVSPTPYTVRRIYRTAMRSVQNSTLKCGGLNHNSVYFGIFKMFFIP